MDLEKTKTSRFSPTRLCVVSRQRVSCPASRQRSDLAVLFQDRVRTADCARSPKHIAEVTLFSGRVPKSRGSNCSLGFPLLIIFYHSIKSLSLTLPPLKQGDSQFTDRSVYRLASHPSYTISLSVNFRMPYGIFFQNLNGSFRE